MAKFLNDINLSAGNDIQFRTTAGVKAGKIEQDGDNLVLTNAVGDVLLGDGSSDIFIGDGTNNVDIIFEQSGAIKGDGSAVTLTLGGANTTLNLSNPNITGNLSLNATTINDNFTFTGSNGFILFDYEPQAGSNTEYTNEAPLIKLDRSGTPISVLSRMSVNGALAIGRDDTVAITAGDTFSMIKDNINYAAEQVILSSENGFYAYGWPKNMESPYNNWSSRNEFRWRTDSETASNNGLYIGVNGSTQFIDTSRNLKNIGTISSGAITSTGKIQGTELEGTSLDINGTADVSGNAVFHGNTGFGGTGSYRVHAIGTGWAGNGVAIQSTTTNGAVLTLVNTAKNFQIASRGSTLDFRDVSDNDTRRFFVDSTGNLQPGADSSYTLGTNGNRWSNVFADTSTATTFSGDLNGTINTATTAATQSAGNNSTKVATTAYVDTAVSNLIDGAPGALDTLNELAEALNDDDDAVVTLTNSITANTNNITSNNTIANAALPKAGGTMSGAIAMGNNNITGINSLQANGDVTILTSTGEYSIYGAANGQTALYTNGVKKFETTTTGVDITGGTVGMPSGGILNFNSGDVTVTHSSNKLTFDGASAIQINTPASNSTSQNLILNRPAAGTHYSSIEWHTNGTVDWAIGQNSADNFEIFENGADATTRLTIKEGGNVGVGVTNPTSKLHVDGNIAVTGTVDGVDISSLPTSFFDGAYGSLSGAPTTISNAQATKLGYIVVTSGVDLDEISSLAEGAVQLSQTQTISGTKTFSAATGFTNTTNSTSKTTGAVKLSGGMGIAKTLNVGEDVVAYASSDKRYKDNLQVITNPIDKVKSLTGYTFTWNDKHEQFNGNNDIGVVAQEVEKVFPEIVDTRDNGYKAVKYEKMVAVLIEAVKDQQKQIDELKAIIDGSSK